MQSPDIQMGLNTHQAMGAPEGQGLGGRPLLSPRGGGTHLGKKQCQRGGWERPVMGQRRREAGSAGDGARDGWEQPTHHHLLPLAFRGKVLVVGVGGRPWGSDLVQQGALAI